jgi:hypothetical protein
VTLTAALAFVPGLAAAQRVPAAQAAALGAEIGWLLPEEDEFEPAAAVSGFFEYYFTPRVSLRPSVGWTEPEFDRDEDDSIRQIRLSVDLQYNWEGGIFHPFVGAGFGAYFLQVRDEGVDRGDSETKPGFNLDGGLEIFMAESVAFKGEGRYDFVDSGDLPDPSGLTLTVGLKTYF